MALDREKNLCYDFVPMPSDAIQCKALEVLVSDRGIEHAIKLLKRKLASEGVLRELKMRRHYMKPSIKKRKKQAEAARRRRKRAKMDFEKMGPAPAGGVGERGEGRGPGGGGGMGGGGGFGGGGGGGFR